MKNYIKIQLFLCYIFLLWGNIIFAQSEVLQKEVIFASPLEFFSRLDGNVQMGGFHHTFLVYNSDFNWVTAIDFGLFIAKPFDYYGFSVDYVETILKETRKPDHSLELLIDVEENYPNVYNILKVKASRYWRKNSDLLFDKPTFELFKANIDYILLGEEKIWIPNFSYKGCKKQQDAYHVSVKVYAIVNVTAFEPISKEDADVWLKK